jgi:uncharacterized protein YeeX (DUF496 family)
MGNEIANAINRLADAQFEQNSLQRKQYKLNREIADIQKKNLDVTKQLEGALAAATAGGRAN